VRWPIAAGRALLRGQPTSIVRHTLPALRDEVARRLAAERYDVVHAEQVQALAQCEPAFRAGVRVVMRAQNVESDLWQASAAGSGPLAPFFRLEARRLAAHEGAAVRRVDAALALTRADAERLGTLSGQPGRIRHAPAPFPAVLPAADRPLPGSPAVVLFGSAGWRPNRKGVRWFVRDAWPRIRAALPLAELHVFGGSALHGPGVVAHASPADSREAFAPGSIFVVPLRVASGVRMRILEAWARGVPVVATPEAAAGLEGGPGPDHLLASDGAAFESAIRRIATQSDLADALRRNARKCLETHHAPRITVEAFCSAGLPTPPPA
jgi:hypothetical protein